MRLTLINWRSIYYRLPTTRGEWNYLFRKIRRVRRSKESTTKTAITIFFALALSASAQTPTPIPLLTATTTITVNVQDLNNVLVNLPEFGLFQPVGKLDEAIKRYPSVAAAIKAQVESDLNTMYETTVAKRLSDLTAMGVTLSKAATDKQTARIDKFRKDKEPLLIAVAAKDPARAVQKLKEFLDAGIPISKATQDAVAKAQLKPSPTQTPVPTPTPDGL